MIYFDAMELESYLIENSSLFLQLYFYLIRDWGIWLIPIFNQDLRCICKNQESILLYTDYFCIHSNFENFAIVHEHAKLICREHLKPAKKELNKAIIWENKDLRTAEIDKTQK